MSISATAALGRARSVIVFAMVGLTVAAWVYLGLLATSRMW